MKTVFSEGMTSRTAPVRSSSLNDFVPNTLVVSFAMVVDQVLGQRTAQVTLT